MLRRVTSDTGKDTINEYMNSLMVPRTTIEAAAGQERRRCLPIVQCHVKRDMNANPRGLAVTGLNPQARGYLVELLPNPDQDRGRHSDRRVPEKDHAILVGASTTVVVSLPDRDHEIPRDLNDHHLISQYAGTIWKEDVPKDPNANTLIAMDTVLLPKDGLPRRPAPLECRADTVTIITITSRQERHNLPAAIIPNQDRRATNVHRGPPANANLDIDAGTYTLDQAPVSMIKAILFILQRDGRRRNLPQSRRERRAVLVLPNVKR